VGQQGTHWITNPSSPGIYTISVGGTFGGSGNMLVSINAGVTVQATVAESLSLTISSAPFNAINFVQSATGTSGSASVAIPFASNNIAGNLIVVGAMVAVGQTASVSDSLGNAYQIAIGPTDEVVNGTRSYIFYAANIKAGANTVTVTRSASPGSLLAAIHEYSGIATVLPLDQTAGIASLAVTTFSSGSTAATTQASELLFGWGAAAGARTWSAGSLYTMRTMESTVSGLSEDRIVSAVGSYTATASVSSAVDGVMQIATFKAGQNCTADDGASVLPINTTANTVPFGTISPNTFYQGCQDLIVSTNAGGGYSVTVQESSAMKTADGRFVIPDTTCDAGDCTVATATTWVTPTKNGFGHTCRNQSGSDCNTAYANGTKFKPVPNVAAGTNQSISLINSWALPDSSCNSGSTCTLTVSPYARNTLLVGIEYRKDLATLNSVTDNQSETYGRIFDVADGANQYSVALYCLANLASGITSITANFSANSHATLLAAEYSGVSCSVDKSAFVTSAQASPWSSASITPVSGQSELIFGLNMNHNGTVPVTFTADSPFSSVTSSGYSFNDGAYVYASHLITGSTSGSYTSSGTSSSGQNNPQIVALSSIGVPSAFMASSTPATATGRAKYRLSVGPGQPAGTYTTLITYTILGTF
jgi:hypothetical protein